MCGAGLAGNNSKIVKNVGGGGGGGGAGLAGNNLKIVKIFHTCSCLRNDGYEAVFSIK